MLQLWGRFAIADWGSSWAALISADCPCLAPFFMVANLLIEVVLVAHLLTEVGRVGSHHGKPWGWWIISKGDNLLSEVGAGG